MGVLRQGNYKILDKLKNSLDNWGTKIEEMPSMTKFCQSYSEIG